MAEWATHLLNGLAFGMLLFIVASGLTLTFGLMRSVNLAHGSFYMLGGFLGLALLEGRVSNYFVALIVVGVTVGVLGMVIQRFLLERLHGEHFAQIVLTIGLSLVVADGSLWKWGGVPRIVPNPPVLSGSVSFLGITFPQYRLGLIVVGVAIAVLLGVLLERTRLGAMVRASVDNEEVARSMGINVPLLLMTVFGLGAALAAFAGLWGGAFTGIYVGVDFEMTLLAFIIVVLGGLGSLRGALIGSIYVGMVSEFGNWLFPELAQFTIYAPVALMLAIRPQGFLGRVEG